MALVLGSGCEAGALWHGCWDVVVRHPWRGCWGSCGMDVEICWTKIWDPRVTWLLVPSGELGPHRQSAAGTWGRHAGGTVKSDPEVPLWLGQ